MGIAIKDKIFKKKKHRQLLSEMASRFSAMYLIHLQDNTYEEIQADTVFRKRLPQKGDIPAVHRLLFASTKAGAQSPQYYHAFCGESLFLRNHYSGCLDFLEDCGKKRFDYHVFKVSGNESLLIFIENESGMIAEQYDRLKMDTLQENYLFSMIVDLKNDTCQNLVVTEASAPRQDYTKLRYSQWRFLIANMFLPDDKSTFLMLSDPEYIIRRLETEKSFKYEIQMQSMAGEYIWVRLRFNRMEGFSEEMPVFVYTVQDIHSDMVRLLQQENIISAVEEKNQQLADINKAKSVFISNMSHEIRTPINAVLGIDEMIIREAADETIRSYAYDIKSAGKMLLSIINDILDYSRIESGKMEIFPAEYSLKTLIDDINSLIFVKMKEKGLTYRLEVDASCPSVLLGDELRIKQVIINLLTNAVKYTEKGSVTFSVGHILRENGEIDLTVKVADTGIGMRSEDMSRLFEAYERLDEKRNHNIEGTGLGMGIVVRLLEQMNSHLEVESVYGKGSVFSFVLPQDVVDATPVGNVFTCQKEDTPQENNSLTIYAPQAKILAVDDNRINLFVLKGFLKHTGIELDFAQSGKEGLERITQKDYDLVFLDHLMPGMDGIETLKHIREMDGKYRALPVVALTANVMSGARERYLNAGFSDFMEKPFIAADLKRILLTHLPQKYLQEAK